jgi:hypothetical protein
MRMLISEPHLWFSHWCFWGLSYSGTWRCVTRCVLQIFPKVMYCSFLSDSGSFIALLDSSSWWLYVPSTCPEQLSQHQSVTHEMCLSKRRYPSTEYNAVIVIDVGVSKPAAEEWRTQYVKEVYNVQSSPNIDKVTKPRWKEWTGRDLGEVGIVRRIILQGSQIIRRAYVSWIHLVRFRSTE